MCMNANGAFLQALSRGMTVCNDPLYCLINPLAFAVSILRHTLQQIGSLRAELVSQCLGDQFGCRILYPNGPKVLREAGGFTWLRD